MINIQYGRYNKNYLLILCVSLLTYCQIATADPIPLPQTSNVPGGIVIIPIAESKLPPSVRYRTARVMVLSNDQAPTSTKWPSKPRQWFAVVGIPLKVTPGEQTLHVITQDVTTTVKFSVNNATYGKEDATKSEDDKADLPLLDQTNLDFLQNNKIKRHWSYFFPQSMHFQKLPVQGRIIGTFGKTSTINGKRSTPNMGLDIAAPLGTQVLSPTFGKVIAVKEDPSNGKVVYIDHGNGFITSYFHLDKTNVLIDQEIKEGTVIGTVGQTGDATYPHLQWGVILNGVYVNPNLFISHVKPMVKPS